MTAIAQALSAALLHFIWQGTLVAFLLWIALSVLRNRTANVRYLAGCAALALMAALPAITASMLYRHSVAIPTSSPIATGTTVPVYAARIARQSPPLALPFFWMTMWRQWTLPVWSLGVFVFALRLVLSCRHVAALRRMGHAAEDHVAESVSLLARHMKTTRAIRVLISTVAASPSVVGWLRPVILLPAATLAGLEPEQLQAILAHEIAHIRRHDYPVNLAQTVVETLLFYHPAVWWASARIRHERELCCDDAAVAACGDAITYARALTSLERLRVTAPQLAMGSTGGSLLYRIRRLAGEKPELGPSKLPGVLALALGLACFAMTMHWAKAQQPTVQQMADEWGITVSSTGQVLRRERVPYPEATYKNGIQGTVTLEATLDQSGNVADAHVLSGPPELRKTALQSVLQWQFADGRAGETQQISIAFHQDARAQTAPADNTEFQVLEMDRQLAEARKGYLEGQLPRMVLQLAEAQQALAETAKRLREDSGADQATRLLELQYSALIKQLGNLRQVLGERNPQVAALMSQIEALRKQIAATSASCVGMPLKRIEVSGVPESERDGLSASVTVKLGDVLSQQSIDSAIAALHQFDWRLECRFLRLGNGDVVFRITGPAQPQ